MVGELTPHVVSAKICPENQTAAKLFDSRAAQLTKNFSTGRNIKGRRYMSEKRRTRNLSNASFNELTRFRRDSADWKDFGILTDSCSVWLEDDHDRHVEIPRGIFNRLIGQYFKERKFVR